MTDPTPTPTPTCYRHGRRETHVRCVRCDNPICPDCMVSAAVGFQCLTCVGEGRREVRRAMRPKRIRRALRVAAVLLVAVPAVVAIGWFGRAYLPETEATSPGDAGTAGPFDGTPAAGYPKGEDGLVMPAPAAVDGWSAAEVGEALDQVRRVLVAVYLDRRALVDHDPSAVLPLLAPAARDVTAKRYREPAATRDVPLISPKARLADEPPRVSGHVTFRAGADRGHPLDVVSNFVVAYPFAVPDTGVGSRLAVSHFEYTWRIYRADEVVPDDRGLRFQSSTGYAYNMSCAEFAAGLLAPPTEYEPVTDRGPDGDPDRYFDPSRSLDVGNSCDLPSTP